RSSTVDSNQATNPLLPIHATEEAIRDLIVVENPSEAFRRTSGGCILFTATTRSSDGKTAAYTVPEFPLPMIRNWLNPSVAVSISVKLYTLAKEEEEEG
ncbi:hypothetical protein LINPERHAP1_LOCUS25957, partial [Linum perenne]